MWILLLKHVFRRFLHVKHKVEFAHTFSLKCPKKEVNMKPIQSEEFCYMI